MPVYDEYYEYRDTSILERREEKDRRKSAFEIGKERHYWEIRNPEYECVEEACHSAFVHYVIDKGFFGEYLREQFKKNPGGGILWKGFSHGFMNVEAGDDKKGDYDKHYSEGKELRELWDEHKITSFNKDYYPRNIMPKKEK